MPTHKFVFPLLLVELFFLFAVAPVHGQSTEVGVCTWHGCKSGAESWSIDDSYSDCRSDLESAGFRGTYYMWNAGVAGWAADYSAAGHEIGSHTVSHPCDTPCCSPNCTLQSLSLCSFTPDQVISYRQNEFEPNISSIEALTGKPVVSAAWPCGCYDPRRSAAASPYFVGARGYYDYVADLTWVEDVNVITPPDFMNLYSAASFDESFIDRAASEGKWAIIVSHSSCSGIDYMGQRQDVLWAAPIGDVLKYIKVRDAAAFANYNRSVSGISFDASHNLGVFQRQKVDGSFLLPIVYDNPVTLKVHVLDTDEISGVTVDDNPVSFSIQNLGGVSYALFDVALNVPRHIVLSFGASVIYSVAVNPSSITGGGVATGTVTLTGVPASGAVVSLASSNSSVASVPSSVTIPTGANSAAFPVNSFAVSLATPVSITAGFNGSSQSATVTVNPVVVSSLVLSPTSLAGGSYAIGTLTLSGPAPSPGATVSVSSSNAGLASVSSPVTVPAGASSATFIVNTSSVSVPTQATLSATYNGGGQSAALTVNPVTGQQWWSNNFAYRMLVTVSNGSSSAILPTRYSVQVPVNSGRLVSAGQLLSSCADLRVVYFDGSVSNEVDRIIENCNSTSTTVWFALQRPIAANAQDASYYIYYANPSAGTPPNNGMNVFVFFEDWENGPTHWTNAGGLDSSNSGAMGTTSIVTDDAFSPLHSQRFSVKAYGGDAFTGFIPITPGRSYALSVWGKSATGADLPVGFDPYNSSHVKGNETWLWTSQWTVPSVWNQRTATFTPASTVAYLKLKSEWWGSGPGTAPVYADNLALRYYLAPEPVLSIGGPENAQSGPTLSTFSLNPTSLVGGGASTATVALNGAAPSGGATVTLSSGNTAVATLPPSVSIAAGANNATFTVSTVSVGSAMQVLLTATYNASAQSASLAVNPNSVSTLTLDSLSIVGGPSGTSTATVTLTGPAPADGAVVTLASSNTSAATVPSNVTVLAGNNSATFPVTTLAVSATTSATILASYNGVQTAILTVNPAAAALASISVTPTSVIGGNSSTATITLTGSAPIGGALITLTSNNTAVTAVPASVTVAAGAPSVTFPVSTTPVSSATPVLISATYNSATQSTTLTVNALAVSSLSLNPASVIAGGASTGTVTLNGAAPSGGAVVALSSSNSAFLTLPANITVPAGATTATFAISTLPVAASTQVAISAAYNTVQSATLTVNPITISSVSVNPASLIGSAAATGTVTLNSAAPAGGIVVSLTSGNPAIVSVPANVTVPSGLVSVSFAINTNVASVNTPVSLTAKYNSSSQSATLTVNPLAIASLGLNPSSLIGGASSTGTVTLNAPAPFAGAAVSLTSSNTSAATVPASVTVPAGATTASFTVNTFIVTTATQASIAASYNGSSNSLIVSVNVSPSELSWWGAAWAARSSVAVKNNSTSAALPVHYSVQTPFNTSSLIAAGQLLASCADLRVVYFDGTANNEIDRVIENCGTASTTVWFSLQRPIAASAQDASYYLYYGNPSAGLPPANGMSVFLFFEDWENGAAHWISAGGLDPANGGTMGTTSVVTDDAFSPIHSQRFSQKAYGGDAFSGLIPVSPGTRYAVSIWAKSATGAYLPVGFDPYNPSKVKGTEVWLWTNAWTIPTTWTQRNATFTAGSTVSFIRLKTEWWGSGPGTAPVYADNLVLRYSATTEPTLALGSQEGNPSH